MNIIRPPYNGGSTALEILLITISSFLLIVIATYFSNLLLKRNAFWKRFLLEFIVILIPQVLIFTILALEEYLIGTMVMLDLIALSCMFLAGRSKRERYEGPPRRSVQDERPEDIICYVSNARALVNISTCIAIVAVDFYIFPHRLCETTVGGFSLVDLGVGLFVCANGILAPEVIHPDDPFFRMLWSVTKVLLLGTLKRIYDVLMRLPRADPDLGLFWNNFFILGSSQFISSCIVKITGLKIITYVGLAILIIHEFLLQTWVFDYITPKFAVMKFVSRNWEGICSILGYVSLYLLSMALGRFLHGREGQQRVRVERYRVEIIYYLLCVVLISLFLTFIAYENFYVMSKLANIGYVLWVYSIGCLIITLFYINFATQEYFFGYNCIQVPLIFEAINYNSLLFYILFNTFAGLINMNLDKIYNTFFISTTRTLTVIYLYLFLICYFTVYLYIKKIKFLNF